MHFYYAVLFLKVHSKFQFIDILKRSLLILFWKLYYSWLIWDNCPKFILFKKIKSRIQFRKKQVFYYSMIFLYLQGLIRFAKWNKFLSLSKKNWNTIHCLSERTSFFKNSFFRFLKRFRERFVLTGPKCHKTSLFID